MGDVNWLRPSLSIPTYALTNLFSILEGPTAPDSPRELTPMAEKELQMIDEALRRARLDRTESLDKLLLVVCHSPHSPTAILMQDTNIIEWMSLGHKPKEKLEASVNKVCDLVTRGRLRLRQLTGQDPAEMIVPYKDSQIKSSHQLDEALAECFCLFCWSNSL